MRYARWLDHLPPWLGWLSLLSTGVYEVTELLFMAVPLALALGVEALRWDLRGWRRAMELTALGAFLVMVLARLGLVPTVVYTLFLLCGVRLSLPRELPQRRQVLLMGFLLYLTTAIATTEIGFLVWSMAWVAGASLVMLQHAWEGSARHRRGPMQPAPLARPLVWTGVILLLAVPFFALMPRLAVGMRPLPVGIRGFAVAQTGLSDYLDLTGSGPIGGNSAVVLRILPALPLEAPEVERVARDFALLRGIVLESLDGQRWEPVPSPMDPRVRLDFGSQGETRESFDFFLSPSRVNLLPLPYGSLQVDLPQRFMPRIIYGSGLRMPMFTSPQPFRILRLDRNEAFIVPDAWVSGKRRAALLHPGEGTEAVKAWVDREAPGLQDPQALAGRLEASLRRFGYTLSNPSGEASNPLQDFLERSRAGHCEYFASVMAIALRHRGVPTRVVNGYRLGPWIEEGGYWLVTQDQAHSWVEYYDAAQRLWRVSDPTPPAGTSEMDAQSFWAALQRWTDAIRFRWDRHVVRFSDRDQQAGLAWAREALAGVRLPRLPRPTRLQGITTGLLLAAAALLWTFRGRWWPSDLLSGTPPHALRALRPLLRAAGRAAPPEPGETLHQWLLRLARFRPERSAQLRCLAGEADRVAYGGSDPGVLRNLVAEEQRAWRRSGSGPFRT